MNVGDKVKMIKPCKPTCPICKIHVGKLYTVKKIRPIFVRVKENDHPWFKDQFKVAVESILLPDSLFEI